MTHLQVDQQIQVVLWDPGILVVPVTDTGAWYVCPHLSVCGTFFPPSQSPPTLPPPPLPTVLSQTADFSLQHNIKGSRPEWCISSMIYSRDTPFWLETLDDNYVNHFSHRNVRLSNATSTSSFVSLSSNST